VFFPSKAVGLVFSSISRRDPHWLPCFVLTASLPPSAPATGPCSSLCCSTKWIFPRWYMRRPWPEQRCPSIPAIQSQMNPVTFVIYLLHKLIRRVQLLARTTLSPFPHIRTMDPPPTTSPFNQLQYAPFFLPTVARPSQCFRTAADGSDHCRPDKTFSPTSFSFPPCQQHLTFSAVYVLTPSADDGCLLNSSGSFSPPPFPGSNL